MKTLEVVLAVPRGADVIVGGAERPGFDPGMRPIERHVARRGPPRAPGPGALAVVIDVLRATTTLTVALGHGARAVRVAATVEEARALTGETPDALLCGERGGRPIAGFDLGNSPFEYGAERVAGRTLVFASTNGSQALRFAATARRTLLAAFVNAGAVIARAADESEVWLVASGKIGEPAIEDVACAGWIARALFARGFAAGGPEVQLALDVAPRDAAGVRALVEGCSHARLLAALGPSFEKDVAFCATLDALAEAFEI